MAGKSGGSARAGNARPRAAGPGKAEIMAGDDYRRTRAYIRGIMPQLKRAPEGCLAHPYLNVGLGPCYGGHIYAWDAHHMALRFAAAGEPEQARFFLDNLLAHQAASGYVPSIVSAANGPVSGFHAQPFLARSAAVYAARTGDLAWARKVLPGLRAYLDYWLEKHAAPFGLHRWRYPYMSGIDNEIAATIFPPDSIISPDLDAWLCLELRAVAFLAGKSGARAAAKEARARADALAEAVEHFLWHEALGTYAAYDLGAGRLRVSWGDSADGDAGSVPGDVGRFAFLGCPALVPLFARLAEPGRARRVIEAYLLSPDHFRSPWGIRSLSRASEYCNQARWGNPPRYGDPRRLTNSNWQGPVWILLNWHAFHALLHYGFPAEAAALAADTCRLVAVNLDRFGFLRENFDAETGDGLYADRFASWNILADLMPDYLPGGDSPLDLFPWT